MAAGAAAALLDELMGRDRNLAPSEQRTEIHWSDSDVCRYFLCGFCPHELFVNTRADLGPCDKVHDDAFRKEYQNSSRFGKVGYEDDFLRFLQSLISDVEKRIRRGHQRLALNSTQGSVNNVGGTAGPIPTQKEEKISMLTEKINELVNQTEELGCEGKVEEAQGVMKLCDQLREERRQLENNTNPELPQLKQMEVCDTCGAFLIVGDVPQRHDEHLLGKQHVGYAQVRAQVETMKNETGPFYTDPEKTLEVCGCCSALLVVGDAQQRIDEHLMGKQHMGYARIRAFLEEHKQQKIKTELDEKEAREAKLVKEREDREKEREKEREERRKKEKEREEEKRREREKEREKERDKERDKERERRRKRSRSRSRGKRSRSRDKRSRSRDRRRSSSRDRKKRSRSRSRHRHRSRSRDRRRHRSRSRSRGRRSRSRNRRSRSRKRSRSRSKRSRSRDRRKRSRSRDRKRRSRSRDRKSGDRGKKSEEKENRSRTPEKGVKEDTETKLNESNEKQETNGEKLNNSKSEDENPNPPEAISQLDKEDPKPASDLPAMEEDTKADTVPPMTLTQEETPMEQDSSSVEVPPAAEQEGDTV